MIRTARATGVSAYPKDASYWSAVHRLDVARLFVLALESAPAGSRLHGIDDEVIPVREVAEVIARHLNLPLKALPAADLPTQFSWLTPFVTLDARTSSTFTKALLTWTPTQPPLLQDLEQSHYFLEN
jgi:nucleoside-diphosphate-sugar epimerase